MNLKEQARLGYAYLRPLQIAFESPKFMLPIRLGMINADGPQELFIYMLTRKGRVETTNYRTVKLPTGMDVPVFVKGAFADFYRAMFNKQVQQEGHAGGVSGICLGHELVRSLLPRIPCRPKNCANLASSGWRQTAAAMVAAGGRVRPPAGTQDVFLTRLHVRYDAAHFPEDLRFQETAERKNFLIPSDFVVGEKPV